MSKTGSYLGGHGLAHTDTSGPSVEDLIELNAQIRRYGRESVSDGAPAWMTDGVPLDDYRKAHARGNHKKRKPPRCPECHEVEPA